MKKSANLNLQAYISSRDSDDDYSDNLIEGNEGSEIDNQGDFSNSKAFSESIQTQSTHFKIRDFSHTKVLKLPPQDDYDYDLSSLNTPLLPQNERLLQPVDCIFLMAASPLHFPSMDSDYLRGKPLIFMWKDLSNILSNTFSQYIQLYFREQYGKIRTRLRFYFQIDPTREKLNNANTIRKDVQGGRILYHYIGFGFPKIDESSIYTIDHKSGSFVHYPVKFLFENLKPPAWLIFDCSNAGSILKTLEKTATEKINSISEKNNASNYVRPIDWKDWFCICATDVNEDLPIDPHIPRDFLTSCLLSPVKMAVICHIIQYYRTTIVNDYFPLDQMNSPLLSEDSPLYSALQRTLSAITDSIAVDSLSPDVFRLLFRKDRLTMVLFQRFLLAQYLLKPFQVHPKSNPSIPDLSPHPLWHHWRTIVDMSVASILTPKPSFATDLFVRANESFRGFIDRKEEGLISPALLMLLFHIPENMPNRNDSFVLLAKYAATSEVARNVLSRTALFNSVFGALVKNKNDIITSQDNSTKNANTNNNNNNTNNNMNNNNNNIDKNKNNTNNNNNNDNSNNNNTNNNNKNNKYDNDSDDISNNNTNNCNGNGTSASKSMSYNYNDEDYSDNDNGNGDSMLGCPANFELKVFHSLLYLVISLLQNSPQFVNDIRHEYDVSSFPQRLFDESLPMYTRTLVATIIASVLPHLEGIRSVAVSPTFLVSMQRLLENSDGPLSLWALIIQRRMFDSFGSELKNFFSISMHIQVASFAMHSSPEVRAAALATIPCFLDQHSDVSNAQLFGLTMLTAFDASFLVRFNFVLFLSRFLTIYQDKINGQKPLGKFSHQCFRSIVAKWIDQPLFEEKPFEELISDFSQISAFVDAILSAPNFLLKLVQIALLLVDYLVDDPHPSVKSSAMELNNFVQMQNDAKQRKKSQPDLALPISNDQIFDQHEKEFLGEGSNGPLFEEFLSSSKERPALCESGGDALYKVCIRQVVAAGCSLNLETEIDEKPVISALPVPLVSQMPSTKAVLKSKTKIDCGRPTICAYNPLSLSLAVGTISGNVIYQCEEEMSSSTYSNSQSVSTSILQSPSHPSSLGSSSVSYGGNNSGMGSLGNNISNSGIGSFGSNLSGNNSFSTYHYSCNNDPNSTYVNNTDDNNSNLNGKFFSHNFSQKITSLTVTDWSHHSDLLLIGTEDGSAFVWEPRIQQQPRVCFRADAPSNCSSMPLLMTPQQPNKVLTARGNNGTVRLWDIGTQKIVGEWDVGGNQAVTALTTSPTESNVCVIGFLNGLIVTIDLRIALKSGPTNVDAPKANEKILRIIGNNSTPTLYWAGTSKGSLMKWETLNNWQIVQEGQILTDFDVHPTNPLAVLSPTNGCPYITDTDMKIRHQMKNVEHGSVCSFHPALPIISFAQPSGEVVQYELISSK